MEQQKKGLVYDRWSIVFVLAIFIILLFFILKGKNRIWTIYAGLPVLVYTGYIIKFGSGRIRKNDYKGDILYKGEEDCGLSEEPKKHIDGIFIKDKYYKTADGTDIIIEEDGAVYPAGFGTRLINYLDGAGYLNEAPDECWE